MSGLGKVATLLATAAALSAAILVTTAAGDDRAGKGGGGFNPADFAGKWEGKWVNETFSTEGPASMSLKTKGKGAKRKFIGVFDLGGNAFGCADPEPRKVTIKRGRGANKWNANGFKVAYSNDHGPIRLVYDHDEKSVSGSGVSPCTGSIAYTYEGTMTTKKVKASTDITLNGAPFAESSLTLKRK
jgi:hypothetical protein